jgi:hypothetical protein
MRLLKNIFRQLNRDTRVHLALVLGGAVLLGALLEAVCAAVLFWVQP